jgi:group I intron endonuclease
VFYVYKISNTKNSKLYIGKTNNPKMRWAGHCSDAKNGRKNYPLYNAMNKYGFDLFKMEIIEECDTEELCFEREIYWIEHYQSNISKYGRQCGYNLSAGGEGAAGYVFTEEQLKNTSLSKMGEKNHFFGKHHSDEAKAKISIAVTGRSPSPETREKLSKSQIGKIVSEETREKLSIATKGKNKGRKMTPEQRQRMSAAQIAAGSKQGSKHPNAKMDDQKVLDMRDYFDNTEGRSIDKIWFLMDKYGLSKGGVSQIVYRVKWKHLP